MDGSKTDATGLDLSKVREAFPKVSERMENPQGLIDILYYTCIYV
jgi:hypothetical protein